MAQCSEEASYPRFLRDGLKTGTRPDLPLGGHFVTCIVQLSLQDPRICAQGSTDAQRTPLAIYALLPGSIALGEEAAEEKGRNQPVQWIPQPE